MKSDRQLKRKQRKKEQQELQTAVSEKLMLFEEIPEECLTCEKPFDKKNKEMVMTWNVVVRQREKIVRLYCPDCWSKAQHLAEEYMRERT